jgi:hypothetical protein
MKDCLVTKLKGVVDNDNLFKLGEIRCKTTSRAANFNSQTQFGIPDGVNEYTIEVLDGGALLFANGSTVGAKKVVISASDTNPCYMSEDNPGNSIVSIISKYPIKTVSSFALGFNPHDFDYNDLVGFNAEGPLLEDITIQEIVSKWPNLVKFSLSAYCRNVTGKVSDLFPLKDQLNWLNVNDNDDVEANFSDFAYFSLITDWNANFNCKKIQGTVESFVEVKRNLGVTTGQSMFGWVGSNGDVTFNGQAIPSPHAGQLLQWTANTITFDGVTINA